MILFCYKPEWNQAFTGATHLIQIPISGNDLYVFAVCIDGDFYHSTCANDCYSTFTVVESRPDYPAVIDMDVVNLYPEKLPDYISKIEAQGIRKAVAHLKENHGGDRYSSSAYLNYADELEGITSAVS